MKKIIKALNKKAAPVRGNGIEDKREIGEIFRGIPKQPEDKQKERLVFNHYKNKYKL